MRALIWRPLSWSEENHIHPGLKEVRMKTKGIILALVLGLFALILSPSYSSPQPHPSKGLPASIVFITTAMGTGQYSMGVAQGQLLTKKGLRAFNQPVGSPLAIPGLLGSKQADIALNNSGTVYWAYRGEEEFKSPHKFIRLLMTGGDIPFSVITRGDTGIKSMADLKGKRLTGNYPTSRFQTLLTQLELQAYGYGPNDVVILKAEFSNTALDDLAAKRTDAVQVAIIGPRFQELATKVDKIVVLPITPDKVAMFKKVIPVVLPMVTSPGLPVEAGIPAIGVPTVLYVRDDMNDDTAYFIVKTLMENQQALIQAYREFVDWPPEKAVRNLAILFHPGAIKYYKEKGLWTNEMERVQQELLSK